MAQAMRASLLDRVSAIIPSVGAGGSALGLAVGCLSLSLNSLDAYRLIVGGLLASSLALLAAHARYEDGVWDREVIVLLAARMIAAAGLARIPEYTYGYSINGVIHRRSSPR